jgi:hypothetical protein
MLSNPQHIELLNGHVQIADFFCKGLILLSLMPVAAPIFMCIRSFSTGPFDREHGQRMMSRLCTFVAELS